MKKIAKTVPTEEIAATIIGDFPLMDFSDTRPYQTIGRYLNRNNLMLAVYDDGSYCLVKTYGQQKTGQPITFRELIDKMFRWAYCAQKKAQNNFDRMCAEEDLEEIEMIRERWIEGGHIKRIKESINIAFDSRFESDDPEVNKEVERAISFWSEENAALVDLLAQY